MGLCDTVDAPEFRSHPPLRLMMSDVDGTLVTEAKDLTPRATQAVFQLREAGLKFTVISSRPPFGLQSLIRDLHIDQPVVAFNGGLIVQPDGEVLKSHLIPADLLPEMLACLREYHLSARLYTREQWLILPEKQAHPHLQHEICTLEAEPVVVDDFTPYLNRAFKLTGVSDDHQAVAQCQQAMRQKLGDRASVFRSQPYYLDTTHPLANKGHAVEFVAKKLNISPAEIAVIGDMPSDVPMFEKAGLSIAMGNADDSVKERANYATDSNESDGFAKAMERYILKSGASVAR